MNAWYKFPNGKVWQVEESGHVTGTVLVPNFLKAVGREERLDAVSEAATGSSAGLTGISYQYRGNDYVWFAGSVLWMMIDEGTDEPVEIPLGSPELRTLLAAQYGLSEVEVSHAFGAMDAQYVGECVVEVGSSNRSLHCPSHPEPCHYMRVVVDGLELAYWTSDEWKDAPPEVMGAIMGATRSSA